MTFPEYEEIVEYWKVQPPIHQLASSYYGWKRPKKGTIADLADMMGVEVPK